MTALHSSCLPCSRALLITFPRPFNGGDFVLYASAIASHWHGEVRLFEFAVHDLVALSDDHRNRSEEHTSELQSLMRNSYAVFCLKKKKKPIARNRTQLQSLHYSMPNTKIQSVK